MFFHALVIFFTKYRFVNSVEKEDQTWKLNERSEIVRFYNIQEKWHSYFHVKNDGFLIFSIKAIQYFLVFLLSFFIFKEKMVDAFRIVLIVNIILLVIAALSTLIYLIPIILIQHFHTAANILTGNVCLACIVCCVFWIISNVISGFYPSLLMKFTISLIFSSYFQLLVNCSVVYSLTIITINRFLTINYPQKRFFKRQAWPFISSVVQWIIAVILPLPHLIIYIQVSTN